MLHKFRGIDADAQGNFILRYADESEQKHTLVIYRGAGAVTIAALIAQANKIPAVEKYQGQPIRVSDVGPAAGADGSPGLGFQLAVGYQFPIFFPLALVPKIRKALHEAEQMATRPPGKPS